MTAANILRNLEKEIDDEAFPDDDWAHRPFIIGTSGWWMGFGLYQPIPAQQFTENCRHLMDISTVDGSSHG